MDDLATLDAAPVYADFQRARGRLDVRVRRQGGTVRLERLFQEGCAKAMLPRTYTGVPEAVLTNTAGGLTGGDHIRYHLGVGPSAALVATTQAAERIYRSAGGSARIETRLSLGEDAVLDWLPQETILFDGGRLVRRLDADLAAGAELTALEMLMFGRAASGERVATGAISDTWRIRRAGRLVHAEALRAAGDIARTMAGPATLGGCPALATLIRVAPDAADRLASARAILSGSTASVAAAAASAKDGVLIVRILAPDLAPLRQAVARFLTGFTNAALPRVWSL